MNTTSLQAFPDEVTKQIGSYVYRLIDPRNGETFYVGKGKGNRVFQHIKGELNAQDADELTNKLKTIREIRNAGLEVIHIIHRHGLTEENVFEVEAALIDAYPGATNIMAGHGSSDFGPMNAFEIVQKYAAEEADFQHNVLLITINKSIEDRSVYDAVRFAWAINLTRAKKADYILAVEKGIIKGVFVAEEWRSATLVNFPQFGLNIPGRKAFVGYEAPLEIQEAYLNKRIPAHYRSNGQPIRYNYT